MIKQTQCIDRSFGNTHFYTLKLVHPPQFGFSEVIIFNKNFTLPTKSIIKVTSVLFASQLTLSKALNNHLV